MSEHRITAMFCRSGEWSRFSRAFHALNEKRRRVAVDLIKNGLGPEEAIRQARKA